MLPPRLRPGGHIRVIAPARNAASVPAHVLDRAARRLASLGYRVSYGDACWARGAFHSSPRDVRVRELHAAFLDPDVDAVLTMIGGYNSNELLPCLDYDLITAHPKVLCGYSDVTAILAGIHARTGLVTYHGPHFTTLAAPDAARYTERSLWSCIGSHEPLEIAPSHHWSDERWYVPAAAPTLRDNPGPVPIRSGDATGLLVAGNLSTLVLLAGTAYLPTLAGRIVLLEDVGFAPDRTAQQVERDLECLLQQPGADAIAGLAFGRFPVRTNIDAAVLAEVLERRRGLGAIPIAADLDFGHTLPMFTIPIGGRASLSVTERGVGLRWLTH